MTALLDDIRAFNRFYTDQLGLLSRDYLQSPYTLTEARILYEIGARPGVTASDLTRDLLLDPAYMSRILKKFRTGGLIDARQDDGDRRSQKLVLTQSGAAESGTLAQRSRAQVARSLENLAPVDREAVVAAMHTVKQLLSGNRSNDGPVVFRSPQPGDIGWVVEAQARFYTSAFGWNDKFEALVAQVAGGFLAQFDPDRERAWIAIRNGERLGSIFIANGGDQIAKLRLLYVDPKARGLGLGKALLHEAIGFSRQCGYRQISLWTNDNLDVACALYRKAGFRLVSEERHAMFGPELNGQTWVLDL